MFVLVRFRRGRQPRANYHGVRGRWSSWVEGARARSPRSSCSSSSRFRCGAPAWTRCRRRRRARSSAWSPSSSPGTSTTPAPTAHSGGPAIGLVGPDNPLGLDRRDPAGQDDITTINRLNLPVGKPVIVYLSSKDVVHSFGLPQMRVKQDAMPGIVQPVWFTPTQTGEWDIACSQLCGLGHFRMRGIYAVLPAADYDAWLAAEAAYLTAR